MPYGALVQPKCSKALGASASPPQIFAAMLGGQIAKLTKEALLNSPAFCRFAQQSSTMAQKALTEAMRNAQPVVEKAQQRSQETLRRFDQKSANMRKKQFSFLSPFAKAWKSIGFDPACAPPYGFSDASRYSDQALE